MSQLFSKSRDPRSHQARHVIRHIPWGSNRGYVDEVHRLSIRATLTRLGHLNLVQFFFVLAHRAAAALRTISLLRLPLSFFGTGLWAFLGGASSPR